MKRNLIIPVIIIIAFLFSINAIGIELMPPYNPDIPDSLLMAKRIYTQPIVPNGLNEPSEYDVNLKNFFKPSGLSMSPVDTLVIQDFQTLWVMVDFKDHIGTVEPEFFDSLIFGPVKSVKSYFAVESLDKFQLSTFNLPSSIAWVRAPESYVYYVNGNWGFGPYPHSTQKLVEQLVDILDPFIDFSRYDNDGDGIVDGVMFIHSGTGAEVSGRNTDIWSHKWGITPKIVDGVRVSSFSMQPEFWLDPGDMTRGVYAHEFTHVLGIPDLYDTDGSSRGIGKWGLMAAGSWNGNLGSDPAGMCSWVKVELGFLEPIILSKPQHVVAHDNEIYKVFNLHNTNFYDLIEYRPLTDNDRYIPARGLAITRVDASKTNNNKEWYPGILSVGNYLSAIVQHDGKYELEKSLSQGEWGDIWQYRYGANANREYSETTLPSTNWYDGSETGNMISNIRIDENAFTAEFDFSNCDCPLQGDIDGDGDIDLDDVVGPNYFINGEMGGLAGICFAGGFNVQDPNCPFKRGDINCSGFVDALDLNCLIDIVFGATNLLCDPCE